MQYVFRIVVTLWRYAHNIKIGIMFSPQIKKYGRAIIL